MIELHHDIMQSRRSSAVDDHISHAQYEERREWKSRDPKVTKYFLFLLRLAASGPGQAQVSTS